jgi:hypothetical protein
VAYAPSDHVAERGRVDSARVNGGGVLASWDDRTAHGDGWYGRSVKYKFRFSTTAQDTAKALYIVLSLIETIVTIATLIAGEG